MTPEKYLETLWTTLEGKTETEQAVAWRALLPFISEDDLQDLLRKSQPLMSGADRDECMALLKRQQE